MDKYIYDDKNGLWYEVQGDYYTPWLILPAEKNNLSAYGAATQTLFTGTQEVFYITLPTSGRFNSYFSAIDEQATEVIFQLVEQMAEREGVTEQLKANNQMEWIARMNNIRNRATEIVNNDIVYN